VAAIAVVAVALLVDSGGGGVEPIERDSVEQQIQDLRQFIEEKRE
jgi:hypothetical protein